MNKQLEKIKLNSEYPIIGDGVFTVFDHKLAKSITKSSKKIIRKLIKKMK